MSREVTGPDALNIGTQSTTESANGLPFADEIDPETYEVDDSPITVRLVRFETDYATGESRVIVTDETLVIPLDSEGLAGEFTFRGENVTFVDTTDPDEPDSLTGRAELAIGQSLRVFSNSSGDYGEALSVYTYDRDQNTGFDSEGSFVIGFETNPDALPSGSTTYVGDFFGFGNTLDLDDNVIVQETAIRGDIGFDVAFGGTGDIEGSLTFNAFEFVEDGEDIELFGDTLLFNTTLSGNGFSAVASVTSECLSGCTSATQIGGAFFGPNAEELIGLAGIDYTNENVDDGVRLVGAGSYIAFEDPEF